MTYRQIDRQYYIYDKRACFQPRNSKRKRRGERMDYLPHTENDIQTAKTKAIGKLSLSNHHSQLTFKKGDNSLCTQRVSC